MDPLNGGILCQGDHSGQSTLKVHWNLSPPQVRAQCVHFQRGLRRFSNEVWVHWFSPPPFGFPFHLFPFTYFCFPLFFHVVLSSCFVISFLFSFAHTSVLALVCTRTSTYTLTQVSGRPGLDNEVGLVSCPCSLGFSFISTTNTCVPSRPPFHVFTLLSWLRVHLRNRPSLDSFCFPSGGHVCVTFGVTGFLLKCFLSRGMPHT